MYQVISYFRASITLWRRQWIGVLVALMGLAVAFAVSMIAILYVMDGVTSDSWLENSERLYRVESEALANGKPGVFSRGANAQDSHAAYIQQTFPEVEAVTRSKKVSFFHETDNLQKTDHTLYFVDQNLLEVLKLSTIAGDIDTALATPEGLIVSRKKAEKLFGGSGSSILGTTITFGQSTRDEDFEEITIYRNYIVRAIIDDIPSNSVFDFELLAARPPNDRSTNTFPHVGTYILLQEGTSFSDFQPDFEKRLTENTPPAGNYSFQMFVAPLEGALLYSNAYSGTNKPQVSAQILWTIGTIAFVLLLTAGFNYINVFTAINSLRGREIAIRRIVGAGYTHIVFMCLLEGLILSGIAYGLAMLLADDFTGTFQDLTRTIVPVLDSNRTLQLITGLFVAALIGVIGAAYPALIMRRARPETLLRGTQGTVAGGRGRMRQVLVAVQSFAAVGVIISGTQIAWQTDHLLNLDRGFETNNVFLLKSPKQEDNTLFKNGFLAEIRNVAGVSQSELTSHVPFAFSIRIGNYRSPKKDTPQQVVLKYPGPGFLSLLNAPPVAKLDIEAKERQIVIPVSVVTKLGFRNADEALGQTLRDADANLDSAEDAPPRDYVIVAVINDIKDGLGQNSISIYHVSPEENPGYIIGRVSGISTEEFNNALKAKWEEFFPGQSYEVEWLVDRLAVLYKDTQDTGLILNFISVITLMLSIAGLYGMARHWLLTRRRELALRKVMGAKRTELMRLAMRKTLTPIIMGGVLAFVPAWYLMQEWLTRFTDKGELPLWFYGFVLISVVALSGLILLGHTIKALREHPATVLYHE